MPFVYLGLGSNSTDQSTMLTRARILLNIYMGYIESASKIYTTDPWGFKDQPPFSNQIVCVSSPKDASTIIRDLLLIEDILDKQKTSKNGPRNIDIDLLLYDDLQMQIDDVEIPHPRMHKRNFVLIPLAEIAPDLIHPGLNKSISELLSECKDEGRVTPQMSNV